MDGSCLLSWAGHRLDYQPLTVRERSPRSDRTRESGGNRAEAGHFSRIPDHHQPKITPFGELPSSHRNRGAPRNRYKDALNVCGADPRHWTKAADRGAWRHTVHQATSTFEENRRASLEEKRSRRKNRVQAVPTPDRTFPCSRYGRTCRSRIGLSSHQRAYARKGQDLNQSSILK